MSVPASDPATARHRLDLATADLDPPLAVLDMDALDANADDLVRRAGGKPVRLASKSVRSRDVLRHVLGRPGFAGILAYSLAEALWLSTGEAPVSNDVVVAYPTADRRALRHLAGDIRAADRVTLMVDSADQLDLIDDVVKPAEPSCASASTWTPRGGRCAGCTSGCAGRRCTPRTRPRSSPRRSWPATASCSSG